MSTMYELLEAAMAVKIAELHTCFPARIESYDHETQKASVKPMLNRSLLDGRTEELPVISNVPVWFPRSGGASITLPVKNGDTCLIACTERSLEEWKKSGGIRTPADRRKHALFDGVAFVGLIPFSVGSMSENNDDVLIVYSGNKVRLKPNGNVEIEASTHVTINCPDSTVTGNLVVEGRLQYNSGMIGYGEIEGNTATIHGDIKVISGDVEADSISLKTHVHTGVETGPSNTGGPV